MRFTRIQPIRSLMRFLKKTDWPIIPLALGIMWVGLTVQGSVSGGVRYPPSHVIRMVVAGLACVLCAAWGERRWRKSPWLVYGICLALLVLVLLTGRSTNNARRWIDLFGGFKLQPSETMKFAVILALAKWFGDHPKPRRMADLYRPALLVAVPAILVLLAPDLGTALTFVPMFLGVAWLAGTPWRVLRWVLILPVLLAPIALLFIQDYQQERVMSWWKQSELTLEEKADVGFHLWHSKMAVGSGGMHGFGWARGPENRLDRLPERHNDFVFPVIAEEHGFVGASLFLLLYAALGAAAIALAVKHRDPFTRLYLGGMGLHFLVHLILNVGVTLGVWPTTGLPLPMVSFGGSSMAMAGVMIGVGLALSASRGPVFTSRAWED
ncbi:MAG: rod shape-determining protein RodA [Planctomycetes bacterium]|nr:rod shape-determining protein RodA [Planctomycetota bacterium]MBT4560718.1 rod shape-determining protein RodA [Planctomycetota bacterium]MBT5101816.1 rod shape-determining protein RodA [Planctomycetota bacterium]MBT7011930.1 rod shape-determining protein RodA [Planctomycetota bacterium]